MPGHLQSPEVAADRRLIFDFEEVEGETALEMLKTMLARVDQVGQEEGWPHRLLNRVLLCVEELSLNTLTYGRQNGMTGFQVILTPGSEVVLLEMLDNGAPFDPTKDAPIPDLQSGIEDRPVGGLGVYLVKEMVDSFDYRREDGWNHLQITIRWHR
ncbi:MAG: ATP-binding protein [Acidimicrobiia bacterium]|nr:ATP-binding protein [bacterium]MXX64146.1 ATP-binding protein [Acidimicrobiia bacterium]MCY3580604.1 ATP-binding protein [bacterium]MCY3652405.1 ATP-binding protein [bacterium]MDE0644152.1 ATP-binding protein [bacterium]